MGDLLLRILGEHQGRFVSGEEIGRRISLSRAAEAAERGVTHGTIVCADARPAAADVSIATGNRGTGSSVASTRSIVFLPLR